MILPMVKTQQQAMKSIAQDQINAPSPKRTRMISPTSHPIRSPSFQMNLKSIYILAYYVFFVKNTYIKKLALSTNFFYYIASLFSSWFSSSFLSTSSKLPTETSYATLCSTVPSSCFFSYILD